MASFAALMILVFVGGSFGDFNTCERSYHELCDYTIMPENFPVNIEELRYACGALKTIARCVLEYEENCSDETSVANFIKIVNFVDKACEEDSSIFKGISNNIKCLDEARWKVYDACNITGQKEDELYALIDALIQAENDITEDDMFCLEKYAEISCESIAVGIQCGPETGDAVREILEIVDEKYTLQCSEELRNELESLSDLLQKVLIEENELENALKKK